MIVITAGSATLYAGARRGELLVARWDQVDTKRGLLTLPTSKSGKPRFGVAPVP
jgi:integrase